MLKGEDLGETRVLHPDPTWILAYQETSVSTLSLFYQRGNLPEAMWPARLYTGLAHHTVIALIGSATGRIMFCSAGDFISADISSKRVNRQLLAWLTSGYHRTYKSKTRKQEVLCLVAQCLFNMQFLLYVYRAVASFCTGSHFPSWEPLGLCGNLTTAYLSLLPGHFAVFIL